MKLLFFSRDYTNHDHRWLQALSAAGYQVRFLRLERAGSNHDERPFPPGVTEIAWSGGQAPFDWAMAAKLQSELEALLAAEQPDILHAGPLNTAAVLAARTGFHPFVAMSWGSDILRFAQEDEAQRVRVREALDAADALIGDCDAVRQAAIGMGMDLEAILAFPWGIDIERFSPGPGRLRQELGWQGNFVVLHTRALEAEYGVPSVAQGFIDAAQQEPRLCFLFAGGGSLRAELENLFAEAGLAQRVHFAGHLTQEQQPDIFRSADLYVSGTFSDGSSVSLMEALASGLPVLVSDIPGNREWVGEGGQGWFFPARDSASLAHKLLQAAQASSEHLAAISAAARAKAQERADWSRNQLQIPRAYQIAKERAKAGVAP